MVQNILNRIKVDGKWIKMNLDKAESFYLIAIKENVKKLIKDQIDSKDIDKIYFEIGIDSGIKNKPLTIRHLTLDFKDQTSSEDINDITAFTKVEGLPKEFYIRVTNFVDYKGVKYLDKETAISINVNLM